MKKILVGILIVVPLLVVLMVGLVTTFVSVRAYIGVEGIEFDKQTYRIASIYLPNGNPPYNQPDDKTKLD